MGDGILFPEALYRARIANERVRVTPPCGDSWDAEARSFSEIKVKCPRCFESFPVDECGFKPRKKVTP